MAKKKKKGKKNPRMIITNAKKKKGKKRRRNPALFRGVTKQFTNDAKGALQILGGRYTGEVAGELGARYLAGPVGDFAGTAGQVGLWFAVKRFVKGQMGTYMRLGLLSETIHQALVIHAGVDIPGQVMNLLPAAEAPPVTEEEAARRAAEEAGITLPAGLGVLQRKRVLGDFDNDDFL